MKKSKIITVLGLAAIALSLSACSNNASSNKTANHAISSSKSNDKADDSKKAELASSKKNAEELAKVLNTDKVNFKVFVTANRLDKNTNTIKLNDKVELPAPEPSTTISAFVKKHNLNKEQKDTLKDLLDYFDTNPTKNDDGSLVAAGVFSDLDSITKGYNTISNVKVVKEKYDDTKFYLKAKVTQHLENDIDTSTVSRDQRVSVDGNE